MAGVEVSWCCLLTLLLFDLPPKRTGKPGRPHGYSDKRSLSDFTMKACGAAEPVAALLCGETDFPAVLGFHAAVAAAVQQFRADVIFGNGLCVLYAAPGEVCLSP